MLTAGSPKRKKMQTLPCDVETLLIIIRRCAIDENDCWIWLGPKDRKGYGQTSHQGKSVRVSRLAFKSRYGFLSQGKQVCHKCDVPSCCNPGHLFEGTALENLEDAYSKGRRESRRLTPDEVRFIRQSPQSAANLSRFMNITESSISRIRHKELKYYDWVPD